MRHKNCLCINFSVSCHLILDISALPFTPTKWGSTFIPSSVQLPARRGSSSHPAPAAPPWTDTQRQDSPSPGSCPTPRRWCDGPAPCASWGCAASYRSDCTAGRAAHCPDALAVTGRFRLLHPMPLRRYQLWQLRVDLMRSEKWASLKSHALIHLPWFGAS